MTDSHTPPTCPQCGGEEDCHTESCSHASIHDACNGALQEARIREDALRVEVERLRDALQDAVAVLLAANAKGEMPTDPTSDALVRHAVKVAGL